MKHCPLYTYCNSTSGYYSKYIRDSASYLHAWSHITTIEEAFFAAVNLILKDLFNVLQCNFQSTQSAEVGRAGPRRGTRMKHLIFFYWSIEKNK